MMFAGGGCGGSILMLPAAGRRPMLLTGDGSDGHPSGSAGKDESAAATGSDLISATASGGAIAVADVWVSVDAWVSGEAWVAGEAGVGGWSVATAGAARLASWLASAARTVASIDAVARGSEGQPVACGGVGATVAGVNREKKEKCAARNATRYPLTAVPIPAATISTNFTVNRRR